MPVHKLTTIPSYSSSLSDDDNVSSSSEGSGEGDVSGLENYAEKITLHAITTTTRLPRQQQRTKLEIHLE